MSIHCFRSPRLIEHLICSILLAGCQNSCSGCFDIDTATVTGNVGFVSPPTDLSTWLQTANHEITAVTLRATGGALSAQTATPVPPPPDVATYAMDIAVGSSTTVVGTASILWSRGDARFGYTVGPCPDCPAPANQSSTCHLREQACMMSATLRLVGPDVAQLAEASPTNLDAYISCGVIVSVGAQEQAWARTFLFRRSEIEAGQTVSLPVRAGVPLAVEVSCSALPIDRNFGFELDNNGRVPLDLDSFGGCGSVDLPIEVEAKSGTLRGYFDLVGETESIAQVQVRTPSRLVTPPTADAASILTAADRWEIADAPVGDTLTIYAKAILRGGLQVVELPHLDGANGFVSIQEGATTDLQKRLVTKTQHVTGEVFIYDPAGYNDLSTLTTGTFSSFYSSLSHTEATGTDRTAPGGASGSGGRAKGAWRGGVEASGLAASYRYDLVLTGLSPKTGALDGSDTLAVPWDLNRVEFKFARPDGGRASCNARLEEDHHFVLEPGTKAEAHEIHLCLSTYVLNMALDPASGKEMAKPEVVLAESSSPPTASLDFPQTAVWAHGHVYGTPTTWADASPTAQAVVTVPDASRFLVAAHVLIRNVGDTSHTVMKFEQYEIQSPLSCGSLRIDCLNIDGGAGTSSLLSLWVDPIAYCQTAAPTVTVHLQDQAGNIVPQIAWTVRSGTTAIDSGILCTNCLSVGDTTEKTFSFDVNTAGSLPSGPIVVAFEAISAGQCNAIAKYAFEVPDPPARITCPAPLVVVGDGPIQRSDPQLAGFFATVSGGCVTQPQPSDDAPVEFSFGTTTVTFVAGALSCQSTVTVEGWPPFVAHRDTRVELFEPTGRSTHDVRSVVTSADISNDVIVAGYQDGSAGGVFRKELASGNVTTISRPVAVIGVRIADSGRILFVEKGTDTRPKLFWWNGGSTVTEIADFALPYGASPDDAVVYDEPKIDIDLVSTSSGPVERFAIAYAAVRLTDSSRSGLWVMKGVWNGTSYLVAGGAQLSDKRQMPKDIDFLYTGDLFVVTSSDLHIWRATTSNWSSTAAPPYLSMSPVSIAFVDSSYNLRFIHFVTDDMGRIDTSNVCGPDEICLDEKDKYELALSDDGLSLVVVSETKVAFLRQDGRALRALKVWDLGRVYGPTF